ncbi:unnamed protein product [Thelazia callipaeda]|uniref:DUF2451 domain-containing protein n=1 Tax=Thelazia callipaeda TaxID=103827 RepID=A0A158RBY1_THECL|nr:unnamed protein product [Thelazia callipaeda]
MELEKKKDKKQRRHGISALPVALDCNDLNERLINVGPRSLASRVGHEESRNASEDNKASGNKSFSVQKETVRSVESVENPAVVQETDNGRIDFGEVSKTVGNHKIASEDPPKAGMKEMSMNEVGCIDETCQNSGTFTSYSSSNDTMNDFSKDEISQIYPSLQMHDSQISFGKKVDEKPRDSLSHEQTNRSVEVLCSATSQSWHESSQIQLMKQIRTQTVNERIANVYSSLLLEKDQFGLLTENQLLTFYHNDLYEAVEDFIDDFLEHEVSPRHDLYEYLERYKNVCEEIIASEIDIAECDNLMKECVRSSWVAENRAIKLEGRCGDQKYATGSATYLVASFHPERVTELKQLLKRDVFSRLDSSLCLQIQVRSLTLQIQWLIVNYSNAFMIENRCDVDSLPSLIPGCCDTNSRRNLRCALSDLFNFLRYPNLPSLFITNVSRWISELGAALLKSCTCYDQQYLLCQLLRLVSPISNWATPLLQSYVEVDNSCDRLIIDNCITMLSILFSSIRGRESFLRRISDFGKDCNSWVIVTDNGNEIDESTVRMNETDLIAFFNQFSVEAIFAKAICHFVITLRSSPIDGVLTVITFALLLVKILNDGLHVYGTAEYRQFCKQIGHALRQSVICTAEFFKAVKNTLLFDEVKMVQEEMNRIVLHGIYYIISKRSLGLWQFLVNFPYDVVSETCRMRCQILLRRRVEVTVPQLYEFSESDLPYLVKTAGSLVDKLPDLPSDDRIYMISALSALISASEEGVDSFANEILDACFLDPSMRDHFYKAGAEAIGMLIDKHPHTLRKILLLIDRNLHALDDYAVEILSTAPLSKCRLSVDDVGVICGKWLINRPPDHPASRIARRLLGSMNWGTDEHGKLWLTSEVHVVCAETLIKGHLVQCKATNGLISKSWNKVTKMASKVPDYEHQFDSFCWDILIRLKLPSQTTALSAPSFNDLASFFVFVIQRSLVSIDDFLSLGLTLWSKLTSSGCYAASVVVLARIVSSFPDAVRELILQSDFIENLNRLLLYDQSLYAFQLITGKDKFPGPVLRLLSSAITYYLNEKFSDLHLIGWIELLCCKRSTQWNTDKCTLYLLGVLVRIAFVKDQSKLLEIPNLLKINYAVLLQQWKEDSKGVISWFTSDGNVPLLIDTKNFSISPWATYGLLLAEQQSHQTFYEALYQTMSKYPKYSLDQCVKKAASKSHIYIPVERLHFHRWLQFACTENISEHPLFPLILQNLAIHLYSRKIFMNSQFCYGEKYVMNPTSKLLFDELRKNLLRLECCGDKNVSLFCKAYSQWLSVSEFSSSSICTSDHILLDHLLRPIIANDFHPWLEYVDINKLRKEVQMEQQLYTTACHIGSFAISPSIFVAPTLTELTAMFKKRSNALPQPTIPLHITLPREIVFDLSMACDTNSGLVPFASQIKKINAAAKSFISVKAHLEAMDEVYVGYYSQLYTKSTTELSVLLKCSNPLGGKCTQPVTSSVAVTASHYQTPVEYEMKLNRQKRSEELASIYSQLFEQTSLHCAYLESIASKLCVYLRDCDSRADSQKRQLHDVGGILFYHLIFTSSLGMPFPASRNSYEFVLTKLGKTFIAYNPNEQEKLMHVVLHGSSSLLANILTQCFTPHCVSSSKLLKLYTSLSNAISDPSASSAVLALLSQFDITCACHRLSPLEFSQFMLAAFKNLVSISDTTSSLYNICSNHFICALFYHFPSNFAQGLEYVLSACDSRSSPVQVFDEIIKKLSGIANAKNSNPALAVDIATAAAAIEVISSRFKKSRKDLSIELYRVWGIYLPKVLHIARFILQTFASLLFDPEQSNTKQESDLRRIFEYCVQVFNPLLESVHWKLPPWKPSDTEVLSVVLDNFVSLIEQIHLLYDACFPPGSENVVTLFWRYYSQKLAFVTGGGSHVHKIIEGRFISIPWHFFWPSLHDLALMNKIMIEGPPESAPLITQIIVRIPWLPLIQHQANQPVDANRTFYSLLFSVLASCVSRPANYSICRASMPKLMDSLKSSSWHLVDIDELNVISLRIATNFSPTTVIDPNDVTGSFFELYRRVCFFEKFSTTSDSGFKICRKQSFFIRTQLALMLRSSTDQLWLSRFYEEQIKDTDTILLESAQLSDNEMLLSRELTSFWSGISDNKFLQIFVTTLLQWLETNPHSVLVLLLMSTVTSGLELSQLSFSFQVIEKCIATYFERTGPCDWSVVLEWVVLPDPCWQHLFVVPSSEKSIPFLPLCANVLITRHSLSSTAGRQSETTVVSELSLLQMLLDFVTTIKPRYVTNEAAFLLLVEKLQNMLLRQYDHSVTLGNQFLMQYMEWLEKVYSDDKSSSIFSMIGFSRKQPYSLKMRYICHLMNLYISQQMVASDQPPRSSSDLPVLNSQIQAFHELSVSKQYAPFTTLSEFAHSYFSQVEKYHIMHVKELFGHIIRSLYNEKYLCTTSSVM